MSAGEHRLLERRLQFEIRSLGKIDRAKSLLEAKPSQQGWPCRADEQQRGAINSDAARPMSYCGMSLNTMPGVDAPVPIDVPVAFWSKM